MPTDMVKGFNVGGSTVQYDYESLADRILKSSIGEAYNSSDTYSVGDYVMQDGQLYRCVVAVAIPQSFDSSKWEAVSTGSDLKWLRNAFCLNDEIKQAILNCFEHVAWTDEHGRDYYDALDAALNPPPGLLRISAVFNQGQTKVYQTDSLDVLRPMLTVTAYYDNGTTEVITSYALSGVLDVGTSTIEAVYGGKVATFDVAVTEKIILSWDYTQGLPDDNGFTKYADGGTETLGSSYVTLSASGGTNKYISFYGSALAPTDAEYEIKFKTGSTTNYHWIFGIKGSFGIRCQVSNSYHGFYICNASDGLIANMTKIAEMANDTVYTIKLVLSGGYVDIYINNTLITSHYDVSQITSNKNYNMVRFTAAGSQTVTGYLYSIRMEMSDGTSGS